MTLLALLFVAFIVAVAFYLNSILDKREEKRAKKVNQPAAPQAVPTPSHGSSPRLE